MKKILNKNEKGITLIALVITIIVLLILAGVAIAMLSGENGILNKTGEAADIYDIEAKKEETVLSDYENKISQYTSNDGGNEDKVVNPEEDPSAFEFAYSSNGTKWLEGDEGEIVAKFYKKNIPVEEHELYLGSDLVTLPESAFSYRLVIEGNGEMPKLGDLDTFEFVGWQEGVKEVMTTKETKNLILPYVTEIVVCDGITSIGAWAFPSAIAIEKVTLPSTLERIETYAFANMSLKNIKIPNSVSIIGDFAFQLSELQEIRIPVKVKNIMEHCFQYCGSLNKIYIETKSNDFTIEKSSFDEISDDAIFYVRTPEIANKIKDKYPSANISNDYNWE